MVTLILSFSFKRLLYIVNIYDVPEGKSYQAYLGIIGNRSILKRIRQKMHDLYNNNYYYCIILLFQERFFHSFDCFDKEGINVNFELNNHCYDLFYIITIFYLIRKFLF